MTSRFLFSNYLKVPVFLQVAIEKEMVTMTSFEEVVRWAPASEAVGRVTGLPAGRKAPSYNWTGLEKLIPDKPETIMTPTPNEIDGRSVVRVYDNGREIVSGGKLDAALEGREFVRLSSAALSKKDLQLRGEWRDMGVWMFELDEAGRLQVPHNVGLLGAELGATPARLSMILNRINVLTVYQPFAGSTFEDCSYYLKVSPYYGFGDSRKERWTQVSAADVKAVSDRLLPRLRLLTPATAIRRSAPTSFEVEVYDPSTGAVLTDGALTLDINAVAGYVPQSKVPVQNGRAEFRVMGLGLEMGESVEVQLGLGYQPQLLRLSLKVIDA